MRVGLYGLEQVVVWVDLLQFCRDKIDLSLERCQFAIALLVILIYEFLVVFLYLLVVEVVCLDFPEETGIVGGLFVLLAGLNGLG
jgi:hypothetical protein